MPKTKSDLLKKLSIDQLREIAIAEGIKIPKGARKSTVIRELLKLSMSKIREYISEYEEEEITRRTVIEEKIRRRKGRTYVREEEKVEITLPREKIIHELLSEKIRLHPSIIEELGEKFRFHPKKRGRLFDIYDSFNDDALRMVYDCFIEKKTDRKGKFLEYRFAQWLAKRDKEISKIDIRKKLHFGEIDVIGYDDADNIICIAECKSGKSKASKEHIDPWLRNVELVFNETNGSLKSAYFINVAGFTDGIKERMLEDERINNDGFFRVGGIDWKAFALYLEIQRKGVDIYLCEERAGKIKQVFP